MLAKLRVYFLVLLFVGPCLTADDLLNDAGSDASQQVDRYHGIVVADPYRWLENSKSEQTLKWLKRQEELFASYVNHFSDRERIRARVTELSLFDFYSTPVKAGRFYFFTKTPEGQTHTILFKQQDGLEPEAILHSASLGEEQNIANFLPCPGAKRIAVWISRGQSRWRELKIVNDQGKLEKDSLKGLHTTGGSIAWSKDSKGFFYVAFDQPEAGEENQALVQNGRIFYHEIGTDQSSDVLIYSPGHASGSILTVQTSEDGHFLVITDREGGDPKNKILIRDLTLPKSEFSELMKADAAYTFLGNEKSQFYFYTDLDAPNGRIVGVDIRSPRPENWSTIIPETSDAIAGGSLVGGNAVGYYGGRFVVLYWKDGLPVLKTFNSSGKLQRNVELPEGSSIWGGISGSGSDEEVFYTLLTLTRPRTTYRLNLKTGASQIFRSIEKNFNADEFVTKHIFYKSQDGTSVPMFIVHKKGIALDGKNPLFMYGYGAFGWNSFLWYQPHVLVWLERGGIYALPRIRGGGEYGEKWHQAGIKLQKKNTIDDYIAAAGWLIQNRYTSPNLLVANGGSASAFVAAIAVMKRPELFGAALIDIPFLDLIRYDKFTGGAQFVPELGSVADHEEFRFLHAISPYHNVKRGHCYPPVLVRVGEVDQTAVPMHGYKFIAALQANQKCENPVLLKVMRGAGHNFGATPDQTVDSNVDALAFLFRVLRM